MSNHYEKYILRCASLWVIHTHAWRKIEQALLIPLGIVLHMAILCEILEISWLLWSLLRGLCICLGGRLKNFISHTNLSIGCGSSCLCFLFLLYFHFLSHICKKKLYIAKCSLSFQLIKDILLYLKAFATPSTPISSLSSICLASFPGSATISLQ